MGAPFKENIKKFKFYNVMKNVFGGIREAFGEFLSASIDYEFEGLDEFDLSEKDKLILAQTEKSIEGEAKKRFGDITEKDEDGYNKIPNKLEGIKADVSETEAINKNNERQNGGRQKTRVDEE